MVDEEERTNHDLTIAQVAHLDYLESWTAKQNIAVVGVNIPQILNYEVVQLINGIFLAAYLKAEKHD
jgi:hypothetical protein